MGNKFLKGFYKGRQVGRIKATGGRTYIVKGNKSLQERRNELISESVQTKIMDNTEYVIVTVNRKEIVVINDDNKTCMTDELGEKSLFKVVSKRFKPSNKMEFKFVNYEKFERLASGRSIQKAYTDATISVTNK